MIKAWYCHNPECGDGDKRTEIGQRTTKMLIVDAQTTVHYWSPKDDNCVECPVCGTRNWWTGEIAKRVEPKAA